MAATTSFKEANGATPTNSTVTNVRHCSDDDFNPGTTNPLVKPAAGTNYSFWKSIYLNADTTPSGTINNVKFYTDGTIGWTGVTLKAASVAAYDEATGTVGTTGDEAGANHTNTPTMTDAATYTSGSPLTLAGSLSNPSTGKVLTGYLLLQADVSTSAVAGTVATETMTFQFDET